MFYCYQTLCFRMFNYLNAYKCVIFFILTVKNSPLKFCVVYINLTVYQMKFTMHIDLFIFELMKIKHLNLNFKCKFCV